MDVLAVMRYLGFQYIYEELLMTVVDVVADLMEMLKIHGVVYSHFEINDTIEDEATTAVRRAIEALRDSEAKTILKQKLIA